ncbi:MAG: uL15 family ribosomal protein, partial [Chloroflexi bacterium]|nr:uL15 family ribosomal protein [Chloroflexota bacterium]
LEMILSRGLASKSTELLKVLGNGDLGVALTVRAHKFSKSAAEKIRAAGGTVVELGSADAGAGAEA